MADIMRYANYFGSIEYSKDDECFFGKILYINDLVNFEGLTKEELEKSFKVAVDDYISLCNDIGKKNILI